MIKINQKSRINVVYHFKYQGRHSSYLATVMFRGNPEY